MSSVELPPGGRGWGQSSISVLIFGLNYLFNLVFFFSFCCVACVSPSFLEWLVWEAFLILRLEMTPCLCCWLYYFNVYKVEVLSMGIRFEVYVSQTCINQIDVCSPSFNSGNHFLWGAGNARMKKVGSDFCLNFHCLSNPRQAKCPARWDPLRTSQPLT